MRVLLLHPEDSPLLGPWAGQRWNLIVDLGTSSSISSQRWQQRMQCPILRSDSFRDGAKDMGSVRDLFVAGKGHVLDEEGIDWWDLTSLVIAPEAESVLVFQRLAVEIGPVHELWTTRPGWPANVMAILLKAELRTFSDRLPISAKQGCTTHGSSGASRSVKSLRSVWINMIHSTDGGPALLRDRGVANKL